MELKKFAYRPAEIPPVSGIGLRRVELAISTGELRSKKIGRMRVVTEESLREWLSADSVKPEAAR
jgi:hypothetical protein